MSVEAVSWALSVPVGGNAKVVLLGLANHAHPDGAESYPSLDRLATYACCDRSTAKRNVRKLVDAGWIQDDGLGPRGQVKYRLAMGVQFVQGGQNAPRAPAPEGEGTSAQTGRAPAPSEPPIEPPTNRPSSSSARADAWPAEADLITNQPDSVLAVLEAVGREHGSKVITKRSLGHAMLAAPGRDYLAEAHRMASYFAERPCRDVVATYRNWLQRADQTYQGNGTPRLALAGSNGRPPTEEQLYRQRQAARLARINGEVPA